ncbi:hypothetical protein BH10ACI4_BH10ACI4_34640 [soil metagenome]
MSNTPARRLLQHAELSALLQLTQEQIDWLVNTRQIQPLQICGEARFDSRDVDGLIDTYKTTAARRIQ